MCSDIKSELHSFQPILREDVNKELTDLRDEINLALGEIGGT